MDQTKSLNSFVIANTRNILIKIIYSPWVLFLEWRVKDKKNARHSYSRGISQGLMVKNSQVLGSFTFIGRIDLFNKFFFSKDQF